MSGGGDSGAAELRKQQQDNQRRIQQGLTEINSIFGGGTYGTGAVTSYDPKASYFTSAGTPYRFDANSVDYLNWLKANPGVRRSTPPTPSRGDRGGTPPPKPIDRSQEYAKYLARTGQLFTSSTTSPGFNDKFYADRKQAQLDVQQPQLAQQFQQTQKGLAYQLANKGLLKSSAATNLGQSLKNEFGQQTQNLDQAAQQGTNQLRSTVEGQRQQIVGQLEASADPAAALSLATGAAASINAPSTFAPLNNLFSNWSNLYLANQVSQPQGGNPMLYNPYILYGNQGIGSPLGATANYK